MKYIIFWVIFTHGNISSGWKTMETATTLKECRRVQAALTKLPAKKGASRIFVCRPYLSVGRQ
jgi:hypothetical protein